MCLCWLFLTTLKAKKKSFVGLLLVSAGVSFFMCSKFSYTWICDTKRKQAGSKFDLLVCILPDAYEIEASMNIQQTLNYFLTNEWYSSITPDVFPLVFPPPHTYAVLPSQVIVGLPPIPVCRLINSSGCPVASHPVPTACYSSPSEIKVTHRT